MPKKTAGVTLRSRQKIKVDFYTVSENAGGPIAFRNALKELIARKGALRRIEVRGERIDVHHIEQNGSVFEGEVGRLRSHDVPAIAAHDCSTKDIDLQENESITERTAFLFDSKTGVLALHARREAVSASRIAELCDSIMRNRDEYFELLIQLSRDARDRFNRISAYKSFTIKYKNPTGSLLSPLDVTTKSFLDGLANTGGEQITITVSSGKKKAIALAFDAVRALLTSAETAKNDGVRELRVNGTDTADELLAVDLITDRMRSSRVIDVVGQSASYDARRTAVRQCYEEQREKF